MTLSNQDFMPILLGGEKQKTVWVALIQAKVSKLEGIISIDDEFTQITHTFTQFSVIP